MEKEQDFQGMTINIIFIASFFIVILGAFLRYYFLKEYTFTIETKCDPSKEWCFTRDCSDGSCPPNDLADYKQYEIQAYDFDKCEKDNCESFCHTEGKCIEDICNADNGDTCSGIKF